MSKIRKSYSLDASRRVKTIFTVQTEYIFRAGDRTRKREYICGGSRCSSGSRVLNLYLRTDTLRRGFVSAVFDVYVDYSVITMDESAGVLVYRPSRLYEQRAESHPSNLLLNENLSATGFGNINSPAKSKLNYFLLNACFH